MCSLKPVPITNYVYVGYTQIPCTLILLDVRPTPHSPGEYDVYLIFRGFADHYHYEPCIAANVELECDLVSVNDYNSLALKIARNGILKIENRIRNPWRVRLSFENDGEFKASILAPRISLMPFFRDPTGERLI